ncbi:hypothetical protein B0J13DRAFT_645779 [Dactylonectria estremocensis]|uniref:Uncharacterized protein n=1 Tax=Dactylonectria estremocensis TaxID=1079267 RepID=A0A9P9DZC6_9HYPO|nr:hypothetical protein B0J13DRAFT_645779 [Dactylonectria estremocensis]
MSGQGIGSHLTTKKPLLVTPFKSQPALRQLDFWDASAGDVLEEVRDDLQFEEVTDQVSCWTFTPGDTAPDHDRVPLKIEGHPVVIPVRHHYPLLAISSPPPDPHPRFISTIDPLSHAIISKMFDTFTEAIGFYLLINGYLQVIVLEDFDYETRHSRLPTEFGGLKVSFIYKSYFPTAGGSGSAATNYSPTEVISPAPDLNEASVTTTTAPPSTAPQTVVNMHTTTPNLQRGQRYLGFTKSFKSSHDSTIRAQVKRGKSKGLFEGKIGVVIAPVSGWPKVLATVSTHVFANACNSRKAGATMAVDWTDSVSVLSTSNSPSVSKHELQTLGPTSKAYVPRTTKAASSTIDWLDQQGWMDIKYNSSNLVLLDGETREARSIGVVDSRCQSVKAFFVPKNKPNHAPSVDVHIRGGQSGTPVCLMDNGGNMNAAPVAKVAGFASFVQMASDIQRYDMEGDKLYKRLQEGKVAFYGAFQVPDELRAGYRII